MDFNADQQHHLNCLHILLTRNKKKSLVYRVIKKGRCLLLLITINVLLYSYFSQTII